MQHDNNFLKATIFSAIISSLASVLTLYAASYSPLLFLVFSLFALIPIIAVSLINGIRAGAISTFISLFISSFALPLNFSISLFICLLLPAFYISFILSIVTINKNTKEIIWLPLSTILFNICIVTVLVVILLAIFIDINLPEPLLSNNTLAAIKIYFDENIKTSFTNFGLSTEQIIQFTKTFDQNFVLFILAFMAWSIIGSLFFMLLFSVYIITRIVADKKLSLRPKDFWPSNLIMPMTGLVIFLFAIVASNILTMNNTLLLCMLSLAIAFSLGFFVSGLAFLHYITIGKSWRMPVLALVYIALFSVIFSSITTIILITLGITSTVLQAIKDNTQPPSYNL